MQVHGLGLVQLQVVRLRRIRWILGFRWILLGFYGGTSIDRARLCESGESGFIWFIQLLGYRPVDLKCGLTIVDFIGQVRDRSWNNTPCNGCPGATQACGHTGRVGSCSLRCLVAVRGLRFYR